MLICRAWYWPILNWSNGTMPLTLNAVVRKAMKLLIVIMRILFIALLCFPSKALFPDLRIRNCAFHEHVAYFYLTNPDIFLFITLICKKFRIHWVGQKVLSSFPVSQEKPKWTFVQPNILFLYVYIFENNIILFWKWDKIWISVAGQRWLPCQWWLSPRREVRMRKIKSENILFICII